MVSGQTGKLGPPVQLVVVEQQEQGPEPAPTLHPPMVAVTVWDQHQTTKTATNNFAQVTQYILTTQRLFYVATCRVYLVQNNFWSKSVSCIQ